jgi:uncharacterized membrane protein
MHHLLKLILAGSLIISGFGYASTRNVITAAELSLDPEWQLVGTQVMNWTTHNQVLITFWRSDRNHQTLKCIEHYNKRMEITRSFCN